MPALHIEYLRSLTQLFATFVGRLCNETQPDLSGSLPEGERVQVVIPPAVEAGKIAVVIRKPSRSVIHPHEYEASGLHIEVPDYSLDDLGANVLRRMQRVDRELLERRAARDFWGFYELAVREHRNIMIAGATGSGKTTLLKTLVQFIPRHERIITIEDTREIELPHENVVNLLYGGTVTATQCMKNCMRMFPARILPGELRDESAYDFIQSVTSGHPGAISTIHGGSIRTAFSRMASLVSQSDHGRTMAASGLLGKALASEIHIVIVIVARYELDEKTGRGRTVRRVVELGCNADPAFTS